MTKIRLWFLVIAGLLSFGIPFLFIGLQLPDAMDEAILADAAEYVILDQEDEDFWALIPGRTEFDDKKMYFLFECTNPQEVAIKNAEPEYKEVGPFTYKYEHVLGERVYINENNRKNVQVSYIKSFTNSYTENSDNLTTEYPVINLSGLKRWESVKNKALYQLAIEGFFETFLYTRMHLIRDLAQPKIAAHFRNITNGQELTKGLNLSIEARQAVMSNRHYGLVHEHNVYDWTLMCDSINERTEHEIYTFFGFTLTDFMTIRERFCDVYLSIGRTIYAELCSKISNTECTSYDISFRQWMHGDLIEKGYKNITYKKLSGIYEFSLFRKEFKNLLQEVYKNEFDDVSWSDKDYRHLLDSYYEYPDYKTDEASVLLFDNMMKLYSAGKGTHDPFKPNKVEDSPGSVLDLSRFEEISRTLKVTKKQAFMLYSYFDYYVNNTVLLTTLKGNREKERIGHYGSLVLRDISDYNEDYLDVVLYTRALSRHAANKSCIDTVRMYFRVNETENVIDELAHALCSNKEFNTDVSKAAGLRYFVEANSYPFGGFYRDLESYLMKNVKEYEIGMLDAMIYRHSSAFAIELDRIKREVKNHYQKVNKDNTCENKFSPYCTKRQLFFSQFQYSYITNTPYQASNLPSKKYISDWRDIIKDYIDLKTVTGPGPATPLPDQLIEVPIELTYLEEHYKGNKIVRNDLYDCMNFIKLYDTDVLYSIFLNLETPNEVKICMSFSTSFFHNSTRYFIRNVQFGPMFIKLKPEDVFFGYFNKFLDAEHELMDYLEGDDCTVDPWIGYSPKSSKANNRPTPFDYLDQRITMYTGADTNSEIRKYVKYHEETTAYHRTLIRDHTGDRCSYANSNPFTDTVVIKDVTDGMQYPQHRGPTHKGDIKYVMDQNVYRPLELIRKNAMYYNYHELDVDNYLLDYKSDYVCPNGIVFSRGVDMTSFYQYRSVISGPRFGNINEQRMRQPKVNFTNYFDKEIPPKGYEPYESFYSIEPFTGITMQYYKKLMSSLVLYYDDLYVAPTSQLDAELIPYFSLYHNGSVSESFVMHMKNRILSSQSARHTVAITFTVLGILFFFSGVGMIIRAWFFDPHEILGEIKDDPPRSTKRVKEAKLEHTTPLLHSLTNDFLSESENLKKVDERDELRINEDDEEESKETEVIQVEFVESKIAQPKAIQIEESQVQPKGSE